jgi:hypothetical protein
VTRRQVRVAPGFHDQLRSHLPDERGPNGEPSATDFVTFVLPEIIDRFAEQFDELPEAIVGVSATRVFLGSGILVHAVAVVGLLISDGAIELVGIGIDT